MGCFNCRSRRLISGQLFGHSIAGKTASESALLIHVSDWRKRKMAKATVTQACHVLASGHGSGSRFRAWGLGPQAETPAGEGGIRALKRACIGSQMARGVTWLGCLRLSICIVARVGSRCGGHRGLQSRTPRHASRRLSGTTGGGQRCTIGPPPLLPARVGGEHVVPRPAHAAWRVESCIREPEGLRL